MKKSILFLFGAATSVALLSSTLGAKNTARGGMHIPVVGYESFAAYLDPGTSLFDETGKYIGVRGFVADIRWELSMPSLGVDDLELIGHATINQDRDGPLLLLRVWGRGEIMMGGEVVGYFSVVDLPVPLGGTMYEATLDMMGVFFEGPLKGCTVQWASRSIGGHEANPPAYLGEIKGFLIVPDNLDIGKKGKKKCRRGSRLRR